MVLSFSSGGGTSLKDSAALMALQNGYWRKNVQWQNENSWKFMRQGLINADYNPLLAIGTQPLTGMTPTATATEGTKSVSADLVGASTASGKGEMAKATIGQIKANTAKTNEEADTQQYVRENLAADSYLKTINAIATNEKMPYEIRELASRIELNYASSQLERINAAYVPKNYELNKRDVKNRENQYELEKDKYDGSQDKFMKDYAEKHPHLYGLYRHTDNAVGLVGHALGGVSSAGNAYANITSSSNAAKPTYTETARFDSNGVYRGHTRTHTRKGR